MQKFVYLGTDILDNLLIAAQAGSDAMQGGIIIEYIYKKNYNWLWNNCNSEFRSYLMVLYFILF